MVRKSKEEINYNIPPLIGEELYNILICDARRQIYQHTGVRPFIVNLSQDNMDSLRYYYKGNVEDDVYYHRIALPIRYDNTQEMMIVGTDLSLKNNEYVFNQVGPLKLQNGLERAVYLAKMVKKNDRERTSRY